MGDTLIPDTVKTLRKTFNTGKTKDLSWRLDQLKKLKHMLEEHEKDFAEALHTDLGKPTFEAVIGEVVFCIAEIDFTLKHLGDWVKPKKVAMPIAQQPGSSMIVQDPLGVVLVIAPWNYPLQLVLGPLIGAIAAGNCCILKPSELAPATSAAVARYIPKFLDNECFHVIQGAIPETTALLKEKFDHIFFTGGEVVGRIVMEAASKYLTPVTLELGGKSPCIVDEEVDLKVAARRIIWGKFFNAGQTCVAPDYLLVHKSRKTELLNELKQVVTDFYGENPRESKDLGRIVNARHFKRLKALLDGDVDAFVGGHTHEESRYISPTILQNVKASSKIMEQEIFGPILPVISIENLQEALEIINAKPKPLALYIFSSSKQTQSMIIDQTSSGGVCVNDTISHMTSPYLPFGGVGTSGLGAYHGRASFDVFSHSKSVMSKATWVDPSLRYPPYSNAKLKWVKRLL